MKTPGNVECATTAPAKRWQAAWAISAAVFVLAAAIPGRAADPWQALAGDVLRSATSRKGLCLDLGCGSGRLALAILKRSGFYVHALETDDSRVEAARRVLDTTGLYGRRVSVEKGSLGRLPYPDYCANLVIRGDLFAEGTRGLSWSEVVRVLRPRGVAILGQTRGAATGGTRLRKEALRAQLAEAGIKDFTISEGNGLWVRIVRGWPKGIGHWSHDGRCTPANNPCVDDDLVKAPFHTLWIAGPRGFTKFGYPLISAGRVLLRHGGITHTGRWKPSKEGDLVQAFDAFNGTLLWQCRLAEPGGDGFVAVGDGVYAVAGTTLYAMNAADGTLRWKRAPGDAVSGMKDWAYYACADGVIVTATYDALRDPKSRTARRRKALLGLSVEDGKLLWKLQPAGGIGSIAIGDGKVFASIAAETLAALNVASGAERWKRPATKAGELRYHRGKLYTNIGVYAAADGKFLNRFRPRGILVGDRAISGGFRGIAASDLSTGKAVKSFTVPPDPFCPKTGIPAGCKWMYGRCVRSTASTHCFFFNWGGTVIGDLTRNDLFPCEAFRSNCRTGVIAGNGLVYNSPSGCGCVFAVRGGVALVPVDEAFYWARPESRPPPHLEKGPAFDKQAADPSGTDDWLCYRHDAGRSNVTSANLAFPLKQKWTARFADRITPPAIAGGKVYVGSDDHSVYAVDATHGNVRWRFRTGGQIWVTPAWWKGRLFVGSRDGWVYCLRADDGRLIWRFRGGPHDRKMIFFGRPESLWPISGGVIVEDGVAYFYAGYCNYDRVFVYALDAATGKVIWVNDKAGRAVELTGPEGGISPHGVSPGGIPAASKEIFYIPQGTLVPAAFRRSDGKLLWWNWRGDSKERSNIEVQHVGGPNLALGGGLLFLGGPNRLTGTSQAFAAVDPKTGRFWGADHPALFKKAGRDRTGKTVIVKRAMWGTKPIRFGHGMAPVVVDDGIFTFGYRGGFCHLSKYLQTQLGAKPARMDKWSQRPPTGVLIVAGDKVVVVGQHGKKVSLLARTTGKGLWQGKLDTKGAVLQDGLAAAGGRLYIATGAGEIACFGSE